MSINMSINIHSAVLFVCLFVVVVVVKEGGASPVSNSSFYN